MPVMYIYVYIYIYLCIHTVSPCVRACVRGCAHDLIYLYKSIVSYCSVFILDYLGPNAPIHT